MEHKLGVPVMPGRPVTVPFSRTPAPRRIGAQGGAEGEPGLRRLASGFVASVFAAELGFPASRARRPSIASLLGSCLVVAPILSGVAAVLAVGLAAGFDGLEPRTLLGAGFGFYAVFVTILVARYRRKLAGVRDGLFVG